MRSPGRAVVLAVVALAASCGAAKTTARDTPGIALDARAAPIVRAREAAALRTERTTPARSHPVATLTRQTLGPFAATAGDRRIAAWIAGSDGGRERDLFVVALAEDGARLGQARAVARVPVDTNALVVRAAGGAQSGWLLAWTALMDRGEALTVIGIAPDGSPRGDAVDLQRTHDHIRWSNLLPTAGGALCVWAEETPSGDADILVNGVTADGKARGVLMRVAHGVDRWQAVAAGDGVALALVSSNRRERGQPAASLTWQLLDRDGHSPGEPVLVARGSAIASNVEAVATEDGAMLAWTDRAGQDARVMVAKVDASRHVSGPNVAVEGMGASSLVALASGGKSVALAWEDPRGRTRGTRAIHLGLVSPRLTAQPMVSLEVAPSGGIELVSSGTGFALLASAQACAADLGPNACAGPIAPTFLRLGSRLEPEQVEPFFVGESYQPATVAWGLSCEGQGRCFALAGTSDAPTPVYALDLPPRASSFTAPLPRQAPADAPTVVGIATLASGQPYNQVASTRVGSLTLVAALASAVDVPGRYGHFRGGRISVRSVDNDGQPVLEQTLTSHALAVGGVAASASGDPRDGAGVAWVARDEIGGGVHVASVARPGRPTQEMRLTASKGGASNVAIAWAGDGWLVVWVDGRSGRVYATKVGRDLRRLARDERISQPGADAADVALAVQGDVAWVAWSDQRDSPREGVADIFAATLHTRDATSAGDEVRVLATARHSRSPALAPSADGRALLAWIEDGPPGLDAPGMAMVACLDATAHLVCTPAELPAAAQGRATAVVLGASASSREGVRAVIARSGRVAVSLEVLRLGSDGTALMAPWPLIDLDAPPSFEVALALSGDQLIFDDVGARAGDNRLRRALLQWSR